MKLLISFFSRDMSHIVKKCLPYLVMLKNASKNPRSGPDVVEFRNGNMFSLPKDLVKISV